MSHALGLALAGALCLALGCSAPRAEVVAREGGAAEPQVRGRVRVVDGQLVSDMGTPLRGLLLPVDVGWTLDDFDLMQTIAQTSGLNTVHVYLENWQVTPGANRAIADALVSLTAQTGLYLVIGIGGGSPGDDHPGNGWFDAAKVKAFWDIYGQRYARSTHVLYEIINNPEITCDVAFGATTVQLERDTYEQLRRVAPDTHILLFSTNSLPREAVVTGAIGAVKDVVDFSNASFAVHADGCSPLTELPSLVSAARAQGAALLISQLPDDEWEPAIAAAEQAGVGWIHHRWLSMAKLPALLSAVTRAKLGWCPDRGDFPQAASGCRAP